MALKETAISGVKWTTVDKVGKSIFQILQVAILTRFLPKEAFGLVAMALVVIQFSNIFVDMGLTTAILHKQDTAKAEYSSIYWLNIFISLILYVILFVSTPFISDFYSEKELLHIIPILGLNVLLVAIGRQHKTIMQKEFRFKRIAIIVLVAYFIGLCAAVILAYMGFGVYSLIYSTLLQSVIANLLFLVVNYRFNPITFHFSINDTKPFLRVGGYQMGSSLVGFFSKEVDVLIIGRLLGSEVLGLYSLSKQIVRRLYGLINPVVTNVLSPLLSSIQDEKERLKQSYLKIVKYLAYINFPIYFLVIVLSKEILFFVYGEPYVEGFIVLSLLAIYYCFNSISNPVGSLQVATGRTDLGFIWTILRLFFTPVFFYLGALYGVNGVGVAHALLATSLIIPMWYIQIRPMAEISILEYGRVFYKPLLIFIALVPVSLWFTNITDPTIVNIATKISVFIPVYAGLVFYFDKESINRFFKFLGKAMQYS